MAIKCIALDLDGTTLNKEGKLSPGNQAALEYAVSRGVEVIIASGRPLVALPKDVCAVEGIHYAVTANGASIWHLPTMECLRKFYLTPESVEEVIRMTLEADATLEVFVDGKAHADAAYVRDPVAFGAPEKAVPYVQSTRTAEEDIVAYIRRHSDELENVDIIVADQEKKAALWKQLEEVEDLYVTSSVERLLELSYKDSGKHGGVRYLRNLLGIGREEVAAFGDADNDIEMLTEAGVGVAMANATPRCLAAADRVTGHHDADGLAEEIYRLLKEE